MKSANNTKPKVAYHTNNMQSLRDLNSKTGILAPVFPELTFEKRFPIIINYMDSLIEQGFNLFGEQELDDISVAMMQEYFLSKGFQTTTAEYCDDKFAFKFLFAFNPMEYQLISEPTRVAFTTTGEFLTEAQRTAMVEADKLLPKGAEKSVHAHNFGVDFEKSAQVIELINLQTRQKFKIYNTHPGLTNEHRLKCMDVLSTHIKKDIETNPEVNIILSGDFNQFDMGNPVDCVLEEQVQKVKDMGLDYVSQVLLESEPATTFFSDPYDLMRHITREQREQIFAFKDSLRDMKKDLQTREIALEQDESFMLKVSELRAFYQQLNQELVAKGTLRLSTVLDGIAVYGPAFKEKAISVKSDTWLNNTLFSPRNISKLECDALFRQSAQPLPSDHLGIGIMVDDEDESTVDASISPSVSI